jgi:hypothetical protein
MYIVISMPKRKSIATGVSQIMACSHYSPTRCRRMDLGARPRLRHRGEHEFALMNFWILR